MHRTSRPTATDVAAASGVSRATVSYVLNNTAGQTIPEATRHRVLAAARDLGYVPNATARALARGATNLVVIDTSDVPYGEAMSVGIRQIARELTTRGYVPITEQLTRASGDRSLLLELSARISPAVVVTMTALPLETRRQLHAAGVSQISALLSAEGAASVLELTAGAARCQADYLAGRGHTTIAYAPSTEPELASLVAARRDAIHTTSARRGLTVIDLEGSTDPLALAAAVTSLPARGCTAVAAYNDEVALAVLAAAQRAHLRIPADLAVIGIDDLELGRMSYPALTTVSQVAIETPPVSVVVDRLLAGDPTTPAVPQGPWVVRRESA